jgi:hypothetical protein
LRNTVPEPAEPSAEEPTPAAPPPPPRIPDHLNQFDLGAGTALLTHALIMAIRGSGMPAPAHAAAIAAYGAAAALLFWSAWLGARPRPAAPTTTWQLAAAGLLCALPVLAASIEHLAMRNVVLVGGSPEADVMLIAAAAGSALATVWTSRNPSPIKERRP